MKNTPSIIIIKEKMKNRNMSVSFSFVSKKTILNELCKLNPKEDYQEWVITIKMIKKSFKIFSNLV